MSFDSIRDSPEAKFTIQIYFCTSTVQLLLLCLRTVQITQLNNTYMPYCCVIPTAKLQGNMMDISPTYKPLLFKGRCQYYCIYYYTPILLCTKNVFVLFFVWCPCMTIDNSVSVQHNGGFLPGIILLPQCYYHRETRLDATKRFCLCRRL